MKLNIRGTQVELSYTLLCLAAASVLLGLWKDFVWCAAAITIHEGGHLLQMARCGNFPKRIKIALFAIDITDGSRCRRTLRQNVRIIFSGPFANFICFLPGYLLYLKGWTAALPFAAANLSVGLFNSLPVMTLDGGQLLYLLLTRRLSQRTAERVVDAATVALTVPLTFLGVWLLLGAHNPSLLFVSVYLVFSLVFQQNRFD